MVCSFVSLTSPIQNVTLEDWNHHCGNIYTIEIGKHYKSGFRMYYFVEYLEPSSVNYSLWTSCFCIRIQPSSILYVLPKCLCTAMESRVVFLLFICLFYHLEYLFICWCILYTVTSFDRDSCLPTFTLWPFKETFEDQGLLL